MMPKGTARSHLMTEEGAILIMATQFAKCRLSGFPFCWAELSLLEALAGRDGLGWAAWLEAFLLLARVVVVVVVVVAAGSRRLARLSFFSCPWLAAVFFRLRKVNHVSVVVVIIVEIIFLADIMSLTRRTTAALMLRRESMCLIRDTALKLDILEYATSLATAPSLMSTRADMPTQCPR
ncbi:hypothetical protein XA68_11977 [Ophiocordyceps unilateralis]|uniref:Uncharacterized protein n=1 Tax=Ophiocordyceps unilateralis TaxID=268505 RepID=A0A2A9PES6_OPHUN|nr:hypothetical protein XA68_11977 [Ophiocordyceps unilateralis]